MCGDSYIARVSRSAISWQTPDGGYSHWPARVRGADPKQFQNVACARPASPGTLWCRASCKKYDTYFRSVDTLVNTGLLSSTVRYHRLQPEPPLLHSLW